MRLVRRALLTLLIMVTAFLAVGLTAPVDAPFSIVVHASFISTDPSPSGAVRPRALVLDVDVKCGTTLFHTGWNGIPVAAVSTSAPGATV